MLKNSQIKKKISDKIALREAKKVLALDRARKAEESGNWEQVHNLQLSLNEQLDTLTKFYQEKSRISSTMNIILLLFLYLF